MSYRIDPEKTLAGELRRVAEEQTSKALADLTTKQLREGVHETRKRLKKVRAVLRLFRPLLGQIYHEENVRFRNAGRDLAPVRDATTLVEALDALEKSSGERFDDVRSALHDRREVIERDAANDELIPRTRQTLETALSQIPGWRLPDAADGLPTGLKRTYKRGRAALGHARASADMERLHEWRKRAKYHRYHCRLLKLAWERPLQARAREAHDLTDLLGEHHDLSELAVAVQANRSAFGDKEAAESLMAHSARRCDELADSAFRLGSKLYTEKPKETLERFECYWRVAQR